MHVNKHEVMGSTLATTFVGVRKLKGNDHVPIPQDILTQVLSGWKFGNIINDSLNQTELMFKLETFYWLKMTEK